jgi:glycosyltransferase involved in cell wall biosynthesis
MQDVSVVIPNWNGKELLASVCLPSLDLQSYRPVSVTVVDNGSEDGSVEFLRSEWPNVDVVELGHNSGLAAAVNHGIRSTNPEFVALVNSDVELDPHWLEELVSAASAHPQAGSFACKILDYDDRTLISTVGDCVSDGGGYFWRGHRERDSGQYEEIRPVFGACTAAALYRRDALMEVGPFDEEFFAYAEDVDWDTTTVLVRNGHKAAFLVVRRYVRLGRLFGWRVALKTASEALGGSASMFRKRRLSQPNQRVTDSYLRGVIEPERPLGSEFARVTRFSDYIRRTQASAVRRHGDNNH